MQKNIRIHMCYTNETNAYLDNSLAHVCGYFSSTVYKGYFFLVDSYCLKLICGSSVAWILRWNIHSQRLYNTPSLNVQTFATYFSEMYIS